MNRKVQSLLRAGMTDLDRMPIDTGSTSKLPCSVRYDIDWVVSLSQSLSLFFIHFFFFGALCHWFFQGVHMVMGPNLTAIALSITVCANLLLPRC